MEPVIPNKYQQNKRKYITKTQHNLFIEAGAGAGKTHEMMNRLVYRLEQGVKPESIVVITFTNAATEEMRSRLEDSIQKAIDSKVQGTAKVQAEKQNLQTALKDLDSMTISTIHSFCYTILQEYCLEAGLSLNLQELEDDQERQDQVFYDWLKNHFTSTEMGELIALWEDDPDDNTSWEDALKAAYQSLIQENGHCILLDPEKANISDEKEKYKANKIYRTYQIAIKIQKEYQIVLKNDREQLSHDQLLLETDQLLRSNPEIRHELQEEYQEFFVDEFQDTDPIQMRIIWLLAMDEHQVSTGIIPETQDFLEYPLRNHSLFVVGDPKQSIYRFRGAQVEEFNRVKDQMKSPKMKNSAFLTLSENFRSGQRIIQAVNDTYQTVFTNTSIQYQNMDYGSNRNPKQQNEEKYFPLKGLYTFKSARKKTTNAEETADVIVSLIGQHPELHYSDFLIITPNHKDHDSYLKELKQKGIPVSVKGEHSFFDPLTRNFLNMVEYCAESYYPFVSASHLRKRIDLPVSSKKVKAVKKTVETMSPEAAIQYLLEQEPCYFPEFDSLSLIDLKKAKSHLVQLIEKVLAEQPGNLYQIFLSLKEKLETEQKNQLDLVPGENAVRLMNVHQVKGLEGNIVILSDRNHRSGSTEEDFSDTLRKWPIFYPSFRAKKKGYCSYCFDDKLLTDGQRRETEESRRLEYVAMTRARYAVIFTSRVGTTWFPNNIYSKLPKQEISGQYNDTVLCQNSQSIKDLDDISYSYLTPSGCEKKVAKTGLIPTDPGYSRENRPYGNVFGTCFHRGMELLVNRRNEWKTETDEERKNLIQFVARESILESYEDIPDQEINLYYDYLCEKLNDMMNRLESDPQILHGAKEIYTEYPFVISAYKSDVKEIVKNTNPDIAQKLEKKNARFPVWISGSADLLIKYKGNQYVVYDYKTDAQNGQNSDDFEIGLQERYGNQLRLYQVVVKKMSKITLDNVSTKILHLYDE